MENALMIKDVCKKYPKFELNNVSFTLPKGCVMGLIGENGAGKSSIIKAILNLIYADSGEIEVLGMDICTHEQEIKQQIGVVLEESSFPPFFRAKDANMFLKSAYRTWDQAQFYAYLERFKIDQNKKISEYSKGMRMKFSIASALSHGARLLVLDEPTSGLDPIVREEVLDIFREFLQNEDHSILMSSHITSDLDKIADYITFLHDGKILFSERRDTLLDSLGILKCSTEQLKAIKPEAILAKRTGVYGSEALVRREMISGQYDIDLANIEQIMLFYTRGEQQ